MFANVYIREKIRSMHKLLEIKKKCAMRQASRQKEKAKCIKMGWQTREEKHNAPRQTDRQTIEEKKAKTVKTGWQTSEKKSKVHQSGMADKRKIAKHAELGWQTKENKQSTS